MEQQQTDAVAKDKKKEWFDRWKARLVEALKVDRSSYVAAIEKAKENGLTFRTVDPATFLVPDLQCDAVLSTPTPYILNVGCGFRTTSPGFRTKDGVAASVVGVDPLAYQINEAMKVIEAEHEELRAVRRFIYPLAGEELSAAIPVGAFDAVWSEDALLDFMDPARALMQAARACRPGGVVCFKFYDNLLPDAAKTETLWKVQGYDGGKIQFVSDLGRQTIDEVRGERVEMHQLQATGELMIKIRRPVRTMEEVVAKAKKRGLIVQP